MIDLATARAQMKRASVVLPDPVPTHPLLDGKAEIGRGEYSIVVDKGDGERVYKVISSPADLVLYTAPDRPHGIHFPVVHANHGLIGWARSGFAFHLLEIERLSPLQLDTPAADLANRLLEAYWSACQQWSTLGADMGRIALYHISKHPPPAVGDRLAQALRALSNFVEGYQVLPDFLNTDSLMMRKDGTLVFSDPVFIA